MEETTTTDAVNTEGTTTEEEATDESESSEDEDSDEDEDEGEDESEKDREIRELREKNKSLHDKIKSGYKKHAKTKETSVSKDDVAKIIMELRQDEIAEKKLLDTFEDAKDFLSEIKKLQTEKGLDIDMAYDLVKGKMFRDVAYRNQILGERSKNYGNFEKKEAWFKYAHKFTVPKIAQPPKED